jgi:RNA polymerase sigma factor (sigma-70 family)
VKLNSCGTFPHRHGNYLQDYGLQVAENKRIYLDEDTGLMIKAVAGDNNAYAMLYKKYLPIITRYAAKRNRHNRSSEDIAQEVLTRVYDGRASYRPRAAFKTYLFTYAENVIHKYQHRFTEQLDDCLEIEIMDEWFNPEITAQNRELANRIKEAMDRLSEKQRQAIKFAFYSHISINEAAKLASCSNVAFRRRICDAKKRLSVLLEPIRNY